MNIEDGRLARPSIPTLPGTDGTIGRQGPAVRPGRLGTLSPSVMKADSGGRRCVVPSGPCTNLPCNSPPRTKAPRPPGEVPHTGRPCSSLQSPTVPRSPPQPPIVLYANLSYIVGPAHSLEMATVLRVLRRGRRTFCRPVQSRALGSPPAGPTGIPAVDDTRPGSEFSFLYKFTTLYHRKAKI